MQIDWFTVGAQIVNFLVLVFLLQRFLYRPILEAMARREARIAARLEEAGRREADASARADLYDERLATLEAERATRIAAVEREAEAHRGMLIDAARAEVSDKAARWREAVVQEREHFVGDVRAELASAAQRIARQCLAELADEALEARMLSALTRSLAGLDERERHALGEADELAVSTSAPLDDAVQARVAPAIMAALDRSKPLRFETDASLMCGAELRGGGHSLAWNISAYLDTVERRLAQRLAGAVPAGHGPGAN